MATNVIGDATENKIMDLVFRAQAWAFYADNTTTTPQTFIGISLHTADPGEAGTASTSEISTAAYVGYTRINKTRDGNATTGWSNPSGGSVSPNTNIDFPIATVGSTGATATWFMTAASNSGAIGTPPTGPAQQLWRGDIAPVIAVTVGVTPRLTTATTISLN